MNNWMSPTFPYPDRPLDRGKRARRRTLKRMGGVGPLQGRRRRRHPVPHVPGDGDAGLLHARLGPQRAAQYSERPDDYVNNVERLARKFETARQYVPQPVVDEIAGAESASSAYGSSHWAIEESRDQLEREAGIKTGYLRLRAYPFTDELADFIDRYDRVYVVEQNRDGQMLACCGMELSAERIAKLRSVRHFNGLPIDARSVTDDILAQEGVKARPRRAT